jgi:hypothetical protein
MTYAEVVTQVRQLSPAERILLVETIMRWMREEFTQLEIQDRAEARRRRLQAIPPASALRGIAKPKGPMPTDQEIKDDYINYLERKYS